MIHSGLVCGYVDLDQKITLVYFFTLARTHPLNAAGGVGRHLARIGTGLISTTETGTAAGKFELVLAVATPSLSSQPAVKKPAKSRAAKNENEHFDFI
jgi:hypothetical protein